MIWNSRGFSLAIIITVAAISLLAASPQQYSATAPDANAAAYRAVLDKYCVTCHGEKLKTAGLELQKADIAHPPPNADVFEKVIRKLRAGAMPPQGLPRPDKATLDGMATYLEASLDASAMANPNPGRWLLHRLNRTEYANAVKDLLSLDIDPAAYLPPDDQSYGFDNIADVLKTSPSLLERYMSASWNISRLAVGNPKIIADLSTYRARPDLSQDEHVDGLPFGTRGGMLIRHNFPLDGEYIIKVRLWRPTTDMVRGIMAPHQVEISVDGVRVRLATVGGGKDFKDAVDNPAASAADIDDRLSVRVPVKAGPRTVIATFLTRAEAQDDDILQPFIRTTQDPVGYQGQPIVDRVTINGPFNAGSASDTPSRRKVFVCRPGKGVDEVSCAKKILAGLARRAYRRPITDRDTERLLTFYQKGKNEGGTFDSGIEAGIQVILASPQFVFRFEPDPANIAEGQSYKVSDVELASRLSFFLWSTIPDEQLMTLATQGKLKDPVVLEQQVRRMMTDPRSQAMVDNFASEWLYLRNLKGINPDYETFPDFDDNLRQAMGKETQLFFGSIMREDRNVMDLLNADYTFVNERLARHYGIPNIYGEEFQKVAITDPARRGLLGQASILTVTSYSTRTSVVQRGKWILTNILGTPPPAPPPNVPPLKENAAGGKKLSLRERMEAHRANPTCAACHKVMDPIGFTLENFDAIGQWRDNDDGAKIDTSGTMYNGTKVQKPADLHAMLSADPHIFVGVLTEKLMTYAIGRGVDYYDMPSIRSIVREAEKNNYRFSTLILGIVKSPEFQMKKKPAADDKTLTASLQ